MINTNDQTVDEIRRDTERLRRTEMNLQTMVLLHLGAYTLLEEKIKECPKCQGTLYIECPTCHGDPGPFCYECNGKGMIDCPNH